jgi:hypothetical protein
MDQLKEYLRLAVKYRFWIVVGVAALLPVIAYLATSGTLKADTEKATGEITNADKTVKEYTRPGIPNNQYKPIVEEKTAVVSKDVDASWRVLYGRQAPLLKWPKEVSESFQEWGRKWPEKVAPNVVQNTIDGYLRVYPREVTAVYKSFHPFDPETGEGIVSAPPEAALMRPAPFDPDKPPLPSLGKVWAAQEKLWIQGTVLDVIRAVNDKAKAKDWDGAVIKQVNELEVANATAQDQRSTAKGEAIEPAPDITDPSKPAPEASTSTTATAGGEQGAYPGGMKGMGGMMGMSGGAAGSEEEVYYLPSPNKDQFQVVPIYLSVLVDQASVNDLIVEFQNSPMSIQVREFELQRPAARVKKPLKGEEQSFAFGGGGYGGSGGMAGRGGNMGRMLLGASGDGGGGMSQYGSQAGAQGRMKSMMGAGGGYGNQGAYPGMGGQGAYPGMGGGSSSTPKRSGKTVEANVKGKTKKSKKDEAEKKEKEEEYTPRIADPYFNIVELKIYGQARFYLRPPDQPKPESASESTAESPAKDEAAKPAEGEKAEAGKPAEAKEKAEAPKENDKDKDAAEAKDKDKPADDKAKDKDAAAPDKADAAKPEATKDKDAPAKDEAAKGKGDEPKR